MLTELETDRPAARRHRPRARPHHRRPPGPPRPGAAGRRAASPPSACSAPPPPRSAAARRPASPSPPAPARRRSRSALAHSRAEEASADQAGLRYLAAAGSDPQAMLDVLDHFRGQEALTAATSDPYAQNHPLWSDRIALIEDRVAKLRPGEPPDRRGRLLARPHGGEARRLPREPGPDLAPLPRRRRLRARRASPAPSPGTAAPTPPGPAPPSTR